MAVLALLAAIVATTSAPTSLQAASVRMRYPEGPAHGFLVLSDQEGTALARGELLQWLERGVVASRLVIHFDDGSLYDEVVRFSQRPVFRVEAYHLRQSGPAFTEMLDARFDRTGRYRVRRRAAPDEDEKVVEGRTEIPEDVTNGIVSVLLKNLPEGEGIVAHTLAFRPEPTVVQLHLVPEGSDTYRVGRGSGEATRFRIEPEVTGVTGLVASVIGKQPDPLYMWIAQPPSPGLVKFAGSLYAGGPTWRIELGAPTWDER